MDGVHRFASNTERSAGTSPRVFSGPACPLSLKCRRPFVLSYLVKDVCIGNGPGSQTSCLSREQKAVVLAACYGPNCVPQTHVLKPELQTQDVPYVVIGSLQMLFVR